MIIPAAGPGRASRTPSPVSLVDILGRTVIGRQVDAVRGAFPGAEIVAVLGPMADKVARSLPRDVKVVENEGYARTAVVRSLALALRVASHDRILVIYGDLVFNDVAVSCLPALRKSAILVDHSGQIGPGEVGVSSQGGWATRLDFGLPAKWSQVAYLEGRESALFRELALDPRNSTRFGWELLNDVIDGGGRLAAHERPDLRIAEIDGPRDIPRAISLASATAGTP